MSTRLSISPLLLILSAVFISSTFSSCNKKEDTWKKTEIIDEARIVSPDGNSGMRFDILTGKSTGIDFNNVIQSTHKVNVYYNSYAYNGAGLGIADLNNDGLQDVYMAGNWVDDKIYINKGNLEFEDVSGKAGISAYPGYSTGVSMVDINNDGWTDIYVCRDWFKEEGKKNDLLFINNGDMTFTESAAEYGFVFDAFSTQANFFDYDNDGDLDAYIVTHPDDWNDKAKLKYFVKIENGQNQSDLFFRNDNGKFTDVSKEAGINNHGYGLSVTAGDVNNDGFLDLYIANDFAMYDFLYMNNRDGTFTDVTKDNLKRNSHFAMGADLVDVNNDGLLDIYTVDMDLEDNYTIKTFTFVTRKEQFEKMEKGGYHSQYIGNALQLNNGNDHFTEVARMAGVSTTGWSWSPLFADYDNDGDRDLFVSNGNGRDFHVDNTVGYHRLRRATRIGDSLMYDDLLEKYPTTALVTPNAIFENNGDLSFTDQRSGWGIYYPSASYGGGFADFDNDGDIDIIVNNINESAFVYRNNSEKLDENRNWLKFDFNGPAGNKQGFGTRVEVYAGGNMIFNQHSVIRGYMTTVEDIMHFGIGGSAKADRVVITWLDGQRQIITDVDANQVIKADYANATEKVDTRDLRPYGSADPLFANATEELGIEYSHKENDYDDFNREFLLPHKLSYLGHGLAVADVNGDGLMDVYAGGAAGSSGAMLLQQADGKFKSSAADMGAASEDMGLLFFDADGDGDQDLYIGSGGSDFAAGSAELQDRLYLNDGEGNFSVSANGIPDMLTSTSAVSAGDYDGDGDLDLFVGSRLVPGKYPAPEKSYILKNEGGTFSDVTSEVASELEEAGMVTDARWSDYNNDGQLDLVLVGEWTTLEVYQNEGGKFTHLVNTGIETETGWFNSLSAGDFDRDGDIDYIAGNFGINCKYKPSADGPIEIYSDDFDGNGTNDVLMGFYQGENCYPIKSRERMMEQCPDLYSLIPTWHEYGMTTLTGLYGKERMTAETVVHLNAKTFKTVYFENKGDGKFEARDMNNELQISSVYGMLVADFNRDGFLDLLSHGNYYHPETETNRQDASVGQLLLGNGDGTFRPISARESGFFSELDAKALAWIQIGTQNDVAILGSNNNGPMVAFNYLNKTNLPAIFPKDGDRYGIIEGKDGSKTRVEFYKGSGYLSQSAAPVLVPANTSAVKFYNAAGEARVVFPTLNASR